MLKLHLTLLVCSCLITGCSSDRFHIAGEQERTESRTTQAIETVHDRLRNSRAFPAPSLFVTPAEALGRLYEDVVLTAHKWMPKNGRYQLTLRGVKGEPITVAYSLIETAKLPLVTGQTYRARIYHSATLPNQRFLDEEPARDDSSRHAFVLTKRVPDYPDVGLGGLQGWALVIRDQSNVLQAMIFSGRWQELEPNRNTSATVRQTNGMSLELLERTAYTEVRRAHNLCRAVIEHSELAVIADGRTQELLPGTSTELTLSGKNYRLMVLDASRTADSTCGAGQEGHVSFGVMRLK